MRDTYPQVSQSSPSIFRLSALRNTRRTTAHHILDFLQQVQSPESRVETDGEAFPRRLSRVLSRVLMELWGGEEKIFGAEVGLYAFQGVYYLPGIRHIY